MKKILFIFTVISLLNQACQQNKKNNTEIDTHQHEETTEISLNNGEKWEVEPKMMLIIKSMEMEIEQFKRGKLNQYLALADTLSSKISELTSSCTMQGKAHDELHKWLVPFMESVDEFTAIKTEKEGDEFIKLFQEDFLLFNTYFK
jgi:hypothetical protein